MARTSPPTHAAMQSTSNCIDKISRSTYTTMNIFALHNDPDQAARWHVDKHVVKMVTETAQCLACAAIRHDVPTELMPLTKQGTPMRGGYHHHPSSIWAGNTRSNYLWLCHLGRSLADEYTARYGKTHASQAQVECLTTLASHIPDGQLEPFAIAISPDSKCRLIPDFDMLDPITQYRLYYIMDKHNLHSWKRNQPSWCSDSTYNNIQTVLTNKPNQHISI